MNRADAEVIQKGECREALQIKAHRGRRRVTIKRADAEAIRIIGSQREEKGDNKKSAC